MTTVMYCSCSRQNVTKSTGVLQRGGESQYITAALQHRVDKNLMLLKGLWAGELVSSNTQVRWQISGIGNLDKHDGVTVSMISPPINSNINIVSITASALLFSTI